MSISLPSMSPTLPGASAPSLPAADFHKHAGHHGGRAHGSTPAAGTDLLNTATGTQPGELPAGATHALLKAGAHLTETVGVPVTGATGAASAGAAGGAAGGAGGGAAAGAAGSQRGSLISISA
jgi:hypothetical protein